MGVKDNLKGMLEVNRRATGVLLDGITDEESLFRGEYNVNHIRWLTGHIVLHAYKRLKVMQYKVVFPDGYEKLFDRGSELMDNTDEFPSIDILRKELDDVHEKTLKYLESLSDDDLEKSIESHVPGQQTTVINAASFLCMHEFYHAGQIATLRRVLGHERTFG